MAPVSGSAPGTPAGGASTGLTFDTVVELLSMLDGSDLPTRIVYKDGPLRLEIERGMAAPAVPVGVAAQVAPAAQSSGAAVAAAAAPAARPAPAPAAVGPAEGPGEAVTSPIAGVFYHAPSPDAPPFVTVGQQVSADDVIGIVEVMKLMNTVRAGVAGTVVEICAGNAELVEFEQVLVRIEA
jgi:acetyl-CoA carboxylase biotin carboxyl carrier protein